VAERRLAISIKGGVSLGAYEAGALTETLRLLEFNNAQPGSTKWYIDVLTGASAGSITAALVALALINSGSNYLKTVWMDALSLTALSPPENSNNPSDSYYLLAASKLDELAARYVQFPASVLRHPALRPGAAELRLRFTLSRVNPLLFTVATPGGTDLSIEQYAATASFFVNINRNNAIALSASGVAAPPYSNPNRIVMGGDAWTALQQTAIASGTFPLAFEPRKLRMWDEQHIWRDAYFVDGGLFDNDPVGEAINVAHDIDWYSPSAAAYDDADRRFMVVHTEAYDSPKQLSAGPDPYTLLARIVSSVVTESTTSGLQGILSVNDKFKQRSNFLHALAIQFRNGAALSIPQSLLEQLAGLRGINVDQHLAVLQRALVPDLQTTDRGTYDIVRSFPDAVKGRFTDVALAMDLSLDVADKVKVSLILIEPKQILAGNPLYGFAGFLVPDFRTRDFEQGRFDAWQTWSAIAESNADSFLTPTAGDIKCPPPIAPEDPKDPAFLGPNQRIYDLGKAAFFKRVNTVAENIVTKGQSLGPIGNIAVQSLLNLITRKALT
jgi:predicted acylesterase/phospholipase RssA